MPARTGLGSSGAYTVGLLAAIRTLKRLSITPRELAEEACRIEIDILKEPVGKQDQFIAAYGGFQELEIDMAGHVVVKPVPLDFATVNELASKARVYYTGIQRSATAVLKSQNEATTNKSADKHQRVVDSLLRIKEIGKDIRKAFDTRDLDQFARLMDAHWMSKRAMSASISLSVLDELYDVVKKQFGVLGGKIIGAGGGGFVMLYTPDLGRDLDAYMADKGMPRVSFFPSMHGARVVSDMSPYDEFDRI